MSTCLFANNATTTLAGDISPTDTSLTVATGSGTLFPNPTGGDFFVLTLMQASNIATLEIVHVTAVSGDTFTIVRGQEGTTPIDFSVGDIVANQWTAGQAALFVQTGDTVSEAYVQEQPGNWAADTGTANAMSITLDPAPANWAALVGVPIRVLKGAAANSIATVTLAIVGVTGTKQVKLPGGIALSAGQLPANWFMTLIYDGTQLEVQSMTAFFSVAQLGAIGGTTFLANPTGAPGAVQAVAAATAAAMFPVDSFNLNQLKTIGAGLLIGNPTGLTAEPEAAAPSAFGIPAIASNAAMEAGTDDTVAASPANLAFSRFGVLGVINFAGGSGGASMNWQIGCATGVVRAAKGSYTIELTGTFAQVAAIPTGHAGSPGSAGNIASSGTSASGVNPTLTCDFGDAGGSGGELSDPAEATVIIVGLRTA